MSGLRRGTKDVVDILLRNFGHPRSKPMELPLLGHRARSCRSRPCAAITRARLLTRLHPRYASPSETPGSPVTSKAPSLKRFPSASSGPPAGGTCPCSPGRSRPLLPARHSSHRAAGFVRASERRETRRGAVPMLLAPQRPSPVARPSPGFVRRHRRTRRVRRLTLTKSYRGVYHPRTTLEPPDALSRIARFEAAHPLRHSENGTPVAPLLVIESRDATTRRGAPSRARNAPHRARTSHHARRRGPCH